MKRFVIIATTIALAACSTPAARRNDPALLTVETTKSVMAFSGCFIDFYQGKQLRPTFTPSSKGGSIEFNIGSFASNYTMALIDIEDLGDRRRIQLFAQNQEKELNEQINACL